MFGWEPQLIIVWSIVAITLGLQLYLLLTWPSSTPSLSSTTVGGGRESTVVRPPIARDGFTIKDLDDVIKMSGWEDLGTDAQGATRRKKTPLTLGQRIIQAGIYSKQGMRSFHGTRVVLTLVALTTGPIVALPIGLPVEIGVLISGLAGLAAYLAPSFWLDYRLRGRQTKMRRALPDALDLVTVCMQGGLSLPAALARVSRELGTAHPMLATELAIVEREVQMGRSTGDAMRQFAQRFNLEELRSLSSVVGQAEKFGGSISGALKTYAESLRVKRRQHAEEMAQKAAVKLLFPTLLCIFPGIFVVILGPTAIRLYQVISENPWGN